MDLLVFEVMYVLSKDQNKNMFSVFNKSKRCGSHCTEVKSGVGRQVPHQRSEQALV